jgi:hypothetical protein
MTPTQAVNEHHRDEAALSFILAITPEVHRVFKNQGNSGCGRHAGNGTTAGN